jgi:polygalacturonase
MTPLLRSLILMMLPCLALGGETREWNILAHGAVADPAVHSTAAIQRAIDAAHAAGGGTVVVPNGRFLTGTLELKSGVRLDLDAGAVLLASRDPQAYGVTGLDNAPVLIHAHQARGIAITGRGVIDGQAVQQWGPLGEVDSFIAAETEIARKAGIEMKRAYTVKPNPCLVFFTGCEDVLLEDAAFLNSGFWSVHLGDCHRVSVRGVRIESSLETGVNADGLDIDSCRDVRVSDCTISTGDDAICLKTTIKAGGKPCEDIVVTGCTLVSTSCALKLGTESHGDFRRIVFSDCVIRNSNRGIGIFVRDGANVSDVLFSNLVIECNRKHFNWWGDGDPIRFVVLKRQPDSRLGSIRNVVVSNVIARGQGTSLIAGHPGDGRVENITLRGVQLVMEPEGTADKRATHGLILRDLDGVTLDDLRVSWDTAKGGEKQWASAVSAERTKRLRQSNCLLQAAPGSELPALRILE